MRRLNYEKLFLIIYLYVSCILNNFLIKNEFIKLLIAAPHLFLIPLFVGYLFYGLFTKFIKLKRDNAIPQSLKMVIYFIFGLLILTILTLTLQLFQIVSILLLSIITIILYNLGIILYKDQMGFCKIKKEKNLNFIIILIVGLLPLIILKSYTGFPGSYSIVIYRFNYIAESLIQRNILILDELTQYLPIFTINISVNSFIFGIHTLSLFWIGPFLLEIIFFIGIYNCMMFLLKERKYALLSSLISLYILTWNYYFLYPPIFELQPRSFLYSIYPYLFYLILEYNNSLNSEKKYQFKRDFSGFFLIIIDYIIVFIAMFMTIYGEISDRTYTITLTLILLILINSLIVRFVEFNKFYLFIMIIFSLTIPLIHTLESFYYFLLIVFFILLRHIEIISEKKINKKTFSIILMISSIILIIYLYLIINNIIIIESKYFKLFDFIIESTPNTNPSFYFESFIQSISLAIFSLLCLGIVKIIFEKELYSLNKHLVIIFLTFFIIHFLPILEIQRVGGVFIIFIIFIVVNYIIFIFRVIDKLA